MPGFCAIALACSVRAEPASESEWDIRPLSGEGLVEADLNSGVITATATNGVLVTFGGAVLTAERVAVKESTGEVAADGRVRIQSGEQVWVSEHIRYNFKTRQMEAMQFRTGAGPIFATGEDLHTASTNQVSAVTNAVYLGTNAVVTTDDSVRPTFKVRAKYIKIYPGKKIVAYGAVLYAGDVPVFYFPYYSRNLGTNANNFNFTPGDRGVYGPFVLGNYTWFWNEQLNGVAHLDYRERRGVGLGPDFDYYLGPWGEGKLKYYYTHDAEPNLDNLGVPIPENRQRVYFSYLANPATNLDIRGLARYESDPAFERDFFEGDYLQNPQPNSFLEVNKYSQNFSLDAYVQPRLNSFLETVERLPDIRLTGFRQQLGASPLYYESESSAGYYRRLFAENAGTNGAPPGLNYAASRADTYHQVVLPLTFFGWLNVTPRVGGRFTYYSESSGPGGTNDEASRGVFNTGAEASFKLSRAWPGIENGLLDLNGLRHILEPSVNYVYVPAPSVPPSALPQFDSELPSLVQLPLEYPDYNAIDSIDSQNVVRWGLRNKLQTKRDGAVVDLVNWDLSTDWRLRPNPGESTFSDLFSALEFRPRSWLSLESLMRYDIADGQLRMSYDRVTIRPGNTWSWGLGHYYLSGDSTGLTEPLGLGNNLFTSTIFFRLNENWGFRMSHYFEASTGRLEVQDYTIYRDLRSWTAALSFQTRYNASGPEDVSVAFTFSLKAFPRFPLGSDTASPYSLLTR